MLLLHRWKNTTEICPLHFRSDRKESSRPVDGTLQKRCEDVDLFCHSLGPIWMLLNGSRVRSSLLYVACWNRWWLSFDWSWKDDCSPWNMLSFFLSITSYLIHIKIVFHYCVQGHSWCGQRSSEQQHNHIWSSSVNEKTEDDRAASTPALVFLLWHMDCAFCQWPVLGEELRAISWWRCHQQQRYIRGHDTQSSAWIRVSFKASAICSRARSIPFRCWYSLSCHQYTSKKIARGFSLHTGSKLSLYHSTFLSLFLIVDK